MELGRSDLPQSSSCLAGRVTPVHQGQQQQESHVSQHNPCVSPISSVPYSVPWPFLYTHLPQGLLLCHLEQLLYDNPSLKPTHRALGTDPVMVSAGWGGLIL